MTADLVLRRYKVQVVRVQGGYAGQRDDSHPRRDGPSCGRLHYTERQGIVYFCNFLFNIFREQLTTGSVTQKAKSEIRGTNCTGHPTWNALPLPANSSSAFRTQQERTPGIFFPSPQRGVSSSPLCSHTAWWRWGTSDAEALLSSAIVFVCLCDCTSHNCEFLISKNVFYSSLNPQGLEHRRCSTSASWRNKWVNHWK